MNTRVRTNIYIDETLKDESKKLFKQYGISLSNGINLLLQQMIQKNSIPLPPNVESIAPEDKDYKLIEDTKDEEKVSLEEFLKI